MSKKIFPLIFSSLFLLSACNLPATPPSAHSINTSTDPIMINHNLPTKQLTFTNDQGQSISYQVEVASTPAQREIGLMNRDSLDSDKGMLFVFEKTDVVFFWMKNTLIPLDIVYIDPNYKIKQITHEATPCLEKEDNLCKKFNSIFPVKYVVELNAGETTKNGIKTGDTVTIQ